MLYATVWGGKDILDQFQKYILLVKIKKSMYDVIVLTCSAMMENSPKQAYCTKFLLRMRTQPPVRTHTHNKVVIIIAATYCFIVHRLLYKCQHVSIKLFSKLLKCRKKRNLQCFR